MEAILLDSKKKSTLPGATSRTSFFALNISALTIREPQGPAGRDFNRLLLRLPLALCRLANLEAFVWIMPDRPSMEAFRALRKLPKVTRLLLQDTRPGPEPDRPRSDPILRDKAFPAVAQLSRLTHLVLRLNISAILYDLGPWNTFCSSIHQLSGLEVLVIDITGLWQSEISALCVPGVWPELRTFCLRNLGLAAVEIEPLLDFLQEHSKLNTFDFAPWYFPIGPPTPELVCVNELIKAISDRNARGEIFLPNASHLSIDVTELHSQLFDAVFMSPHIKRPLIHVGVVHIETVVGLFNAQRHTSSKSIRYLEIFNNLESTCISFRRELDWVIFCAEIKSTFACLQRLHLRVNYQSQQEWVRRCCLCRLLYHSHPSLPSLISSRMCINCLSVRNCGP